MDESLKLDMREIREAKARAEQEIREAVLAAVMRFRKQTGLSFSSIWVDMLEVTTCQGECPEMIPGRVRIDLAWPNQ